MLDIRELLMSESQKRLFGIGRLELGNGRTVVGEHGYCITVPLNDEHKENKAKE